MRHSRGSQGHPCGESHLAIATEGAYGLTEGLVGCGVSVLRSNPVKGLVGHSRGS